MKSLEYLKGFSDGISVNQKYPQTLRIMDYSLEQICELIAKHEESKRIVMDIVDKAPVVIKRNGKIVYQE